MVGPHAYQANMLKESLLMLRRARYSIRDFQYIYDISESNFEEPIYRRLEVRKSLSEVIDASFTDL